MSLAKIHATVGSMRFRDLRYSTNSSATDSEKELVRMGSPVWAEKFVR